MKPKRSVIAVLDRVLFAPQGSVANLLKQTANVYMGAVVAKRVIGDLAVNARNGAKDVGARADRRVRISPYESMGAAVAVGVAGGLLIRRLAKRRASTPRAGARQ